MIIKVDVREQDLLQQIHQLIENVPIFKNIVVKGEALPIGDIIISNEKEDHLIIERKSMNDLLASIKDGRYEEQSYRLHGSPYHNHNIIYLIEGDVNKVNRFKSDHTQASEKLTMYSAMFSLHYFKGFSVFRSFSLAETATILCNMAYKIGKEENKKPFYQNTNTQGLTLDLQQESLTLDQEQDPSEKDYVNVIKKVKKENITTENIGEIMLCQIPGVSATTALTIMEKFNDLPNLIKELEKNPDCLKEICSINAKGQSRKINKTSIANIVKFLLKK
jgi:ERCC4-type nuclease